MIQTEISATGTFKATPTMVKSVTLTAAAAAATLVLRDGGAGGTVRLTLGAAIGTSVTAGYILDPLAFGTDVHATIGGAAAVADIGY